MFNTSTAVSVGDQVRVRGTAGEFSGMTQLSSVTATDVCAHRASGHAGVGDAAGRRRLADSGALRGDEGQHLPGADRHRGVHARPLRRGGAVRRRSAGEPDQRGGAGCCRPSPCRTSTTAAASCSTTASTRRTSTRRATRRADSSADNTLRVGDSLPSLTGVLELRLRPSTASSRSARSTSPTPTRGRSLPRPSAGTCRWPRSTCSTTSTATAAVSPGGRRLPDRTGRQQPRRVQPPARQDHRRHHRARRRRRRADGARERRHRARSSARSRTSSPGSTRPPAPATTTSSTPASSAPTPSGWGSSTSRPSSPRSASTRSSTPRSTRRFIDTLQPAVDRPDVRAQRDGARVHGRGEPPQVEGLRLRCRRRPGHRRRAGQLQPHPHDRRRSAGRLARRPIPPAAATPTSWSRRHERLRHGGPDHGLQATRATSTRSPSSSATTATRSCSTASPATSTTPWPARAWPRRSTA